jgi:peptide deformylase
MALLNIINYPDKRLHKIAKPVEVVDERVRKLVADMAETMYAAPGVGLAATQVDVHERVVVIDVSDAHDELHAFINPEIIWSSDEKMINEEGCLSVPGIYDNVERAEKVRVRALNDLRTGLRRAARSVHPARDGSPDGPRVRRIPVFAQADAHQEQDEEARPRDVMRVHFAYRPRT